MEISKEVWEEFDAILKKYKIPYTTHFENRRIQRAMEYPDIRVIDKHIQINLVIPDYFDDAITQIKTFEGENKYVQMP